MVRKRKRPEPEAADDAEPQHNGAQAMNGTHSEGVTTPEALSAPKAQLEGASDDLVSLHRARFVPWQPSAVVSSATSSDGSLIAVAHESGSIEVWETASWTCRQVPGSLSRCFMRTFALLPSFIMMLPFCNSSSLPSSCILPKLGSNCHMNLRSLSVRPQHS